MLAGETKLGGFMNEPDCRLPSVGNMALLALRRQLASVSVLMACPAFLRKSEIRLARHQFRVPLHILCSNMPGTVALVTLQCGMFALEPVAY
jgi:hypothetical protein